MNMKKVIALGAVAVATVAGASTNYVEMAAKRRDLVTTIREMTRDRSLGDSAALRAAIEALDRGVSTGRTDFATRYVSRCCPLYVRAMLDRNAILSEKVRTDILSVCGYDAENVSVVPGISDAWYVNWRLQLGCSGYDGIGHVRNAVLNACIVPTRRYIRANGGTFVGKEGGEKVKAILDALAAELNAPRFGKADEHLARLGIEVEWEYLRSKMLTDDEVKILLKRLMDGEIVFGPVLQNKLCIVLGVEAYNAFVREYNGK